MAEALARAKKMAADSAGIDCGGGLPAAANAVTVMRERGLDLSSHRSKDIDQLNIAEFDMVVAMSPSIARSLAPLAVRQLVTWNVDDPYGGSLEVYRMAADIIERHLNDMRSEIE